MRSWRSLPRHARSRHGPSAGQQELQRRLRPFLQPGSKRIRVIASRFLQGKLIGPFAYTGTRPDDATDVALHQHRRELRGLYVIASWMNHADMKAENSLDVYDRDVRYVRHYLLDFGASLGSNSRGPSDPRRGVANSFDLGRRVGSLRYAGSSRPRLRTASGNGCPSGGRLPVQRAVPSRSMEADVSGASLDQRTERDTFWGVRIVTAFSDAHICAAVRAGELGDAVADSAVVRFLVERRDRIGEYWFARLNPLDRLRVEGDSLRFDDLARRSRLQRPAWIRSSPARCQWSGLG